MCINEVLSGNGSPVTYDLPLDLLSLQRLGQQGIVQKIELARGEIVRCAPPFVQPFRLFFRQCLCQQTAPPLRYLLSCRCIYYTLYFMIFKLFMLTRGGTCGRCDPFRSRPGAEALTRERCCSRSGGSRFQGRHYSGYERMCWKISQNLTFEWRFAIIPTSM